MSFMLLGILNSQAAGGGGAAFDLLETTTLSTSASSVTFSGIDQSYKHLQLRYIALAGYGGPTSLFIRLNADNGANYATHQLKGNGAAVSSRALAGSGYSQLYLRDGATAAGGVGICDFLDFSNSAKNTTMRSLNGAVGTNSGTDEKVISLESGLWMNTNSVTSLQIFVTADPIQASSRFSLYGVK